METKDVKIRKWGNSFGVIIPKEIVKNQDIKEGMFVRINIQLKNKTKAGNIFGILKGKLGDTEKLMREVDRDFE